MTNSPLTSATLESEPSKTEPLQLLTARPQKQRFDSSISISWTYRFQPIATRFFRPVHVRIRSPPLWDNAMRRPSKLGRLVSCNSVSLSSAKRLIFSFPLLLFVSNGLGIFLSDPSFHSLRIKSPKKLDELFIAAITRISLPLFLSLVQVCA